MKKKILSLAVAAILSVGMTSAFAQSTSQQDKAGDKKECCKKGDKKCDKKGDGKQCKKGKGCGQGDEKKCCKDMFEGLNLTEQQQASLQQIPTPGETLKAAREQNTDQQMNGETHALFVKSVFTDYLDKVKGVLSAEQYTQFLENFYVNSSIKKMDKFHGDKKKGNHKGDKKMKGDKKKGDRKGGDKKADRKADK